MNDFPTEKIIESQTMRKERIYMSNETNNIKMQMNDAVFSYGTPQPPKKKKLRNIITPLIPGILICALLIYGAYGFGQLGRTEWKEFDDQKIERLESYFKMEIPEDGTLKRFMRDSAPGDGANGVYILWFERVSAPQEFMEKAYPYVEYHEVRSDNKDYENALSFVQYRNQGIKRNKEFDKPDVIYNCTIPDEGDLRHSDYYVAFVKESDGYSVKATMAIHGD